MDSCHAEVWLRLDQLEYLEKQFHGKFVLASFVAAWPFVGRAYFDIARTFIGALPSVGILIAVAHTSFTDVVDHYHHQSFHLTEASLEGNPLASCKDFEQINWEQ